MHVANHPALPSSPPPLGSSSSRRASRSPVPRDPDADEPQASLSSSPLSQTETVGPDSPELPPLPALPALGRTPNTPRVSQPTSGTTYYTASWGSPYDHPPSGELTGLGHHSLSSTGSLEDEQEDSPNIQFGLSHLLPSRLQTFQGYEITPTRPSTPTPDSPTAGLHRLANLREYSRHLGRRRLGEPSTQEGPTWSGRVQNRGATQENFPEWYQQLSPTSQPNREYVDSRFHRHKSRNSNLTLRQEDILRALRDTPSSSKMHKSRIASRDLDSDAAKLSPLASPSLPPPSESTVSHGPPRPIERTSSLTGQPRNRKRVMHKGKTCWINLPHDASRGGEGKAPLPLTPEQVRARLQSFEDAGYDTRGFGNWRADNVRYEQTQVQNRPVWPDPSDAPQIRQGGEFRVRVPNKREWDSYVEFLREEKLRALGVDLGGSKPEEAPPSRQASASQFSSLSGRNFSPPVPTTSAGSHRMSIAGPFPPGFVPGSSNHTSRQSIASPISTMSNPRPSMHMHRQSMFHSPVDPQQSISPTGFPSWSPQPLAAQLGRTQSGSPSLAQAFHAARSSVSPFNMPQDPSAPFALREDLLAQMQRQKQQQAQQSQQAQQVQQAQAPQALLAQQQPPAPAPVTALRPTSTLPEVPEADVEDEKVEKVPEHKSTPEIVNPKPGHRHNISAKLEQNVRDADFGWRINAGPLGQTVKKDQSQNKPGLPPRRDSNPLTAKSPVDPSIPLWRRDSNPLTSNAPAKEAVPEWRRKAPTTPQAQEKSADEKKPARLSVSGDKTIIESTSLASPVESKGFDQTGRKIEVPDDTLSVDYNDWTDEEAENKSTARKDSISSPWANDPTFQPKSMAGHQAHHSKSSSKLNVAAKEFNPSGNTSGNPSATFNPAIFSSSSFAFKPDKAKPFVPRTSRDLNQSQQTSTHSSRSALNVAAPAFSPTGMGGLGFSSSEFNFAPQARPFKPSAPSFQPQSPGIFSESSLATPPSEASNKIFTNLNLSDFGKPDEPVKPKTDWIKQPKKSKAIPIVAPSTHVKKDSRELFEDDDGRLAQGEAKRWFKKFQDGDDVPQFAIPSSELPTKEEKDKDAQTEDSFIDDSQVTSANGMSSTLLTSVEDSLIDEDETPEAEPSRESKEDTPVPMQSDLAPATPRRSPNRKRTTPEPTPERVESKALLNDLPATVDPKDVLKTSVLSPLAPAFELKYPENVLPSSAVRESTELPSPAPHDLVSPLSSSPPLRSSTAPSGTKRILSPTHSEPSSPPPRATMDLRYYEDQDLQPTFQEIDAVMQHFNAAGSDFGVEKTGEASWPETSSPTREVDMPHLEMPQLKSQQPLVPPRAADHFSHRPDFTIPKPGHERSDAPSPSPRRAFLQPSTTAFDADSTSLTADPFSDSRAGLHDESPVRRLNADVNVPVSDWDDFVSEGNDDRIRSRSQFFDTHVADLITKAVTLRLGPLERQLRGIQESIGAMDARRFVSRDRSRAAMSRATIESDADDEDDGSEEEFGSRRAWSPRRPGERKMERLRGMMQDVMASHARNSPAVNVSEVLEALRDVKGSLSRSIQSEDVKVIVEAALSDRALDHQPRSPAQVDLSEVLDVLAEVKGSLSEYASKPLHLHAEDVRSVVESAIEQSRQNLALVPSRSPDIDAEGLLSAGFADKYHDAVARAAEESEARKALEHKTAETTKLLKLAEAELALLRDTAGDDVNKLRSLEYENRGLREKIEEADRRKEELRDKMGLMGEETAALKATLEEYRSSHGQWREDVENASKEKEKLTGALAALKLQTEEAIRTRETMRTRIEKVQSDAAAAAGRLSDERTKWHQENVELRTRNEILCSKLEAEGRTRERLEKEMERLEQQEREAMRLRTILDTTQQEKARFMDEVDSLNVKHHEAVKTALTLEYVQKENARLEELVENLRDQSDEHQKTADKYASEYREAREAGRIEVQRMQMVMQGRVEAANQQVNIVRADLEAEVGRVRSELEQSKLDADAAKAKYELLLEQEADSKRDAIREVIQAKNEALAENRHGFEERLEDLRRLHRRDLDHVIENKNHAETFLRETHEQRITELESANQRALEQMIEDKDRAEAYLSDQLNLANARVEHLSDKVVHLEEKLEITKSAAHAAAQAAQAKSPSTASPSAAPLAAPLSTLPSAPRGPGDKISPQALRESIAVLQEQLQEREARIEELETQIGLQDGSLPETLKARDTEIAWLRELLGVRVDDLAELVQILGDADFNREAVRNAAIRIRTGLQMEMAERERRGGASGGNGVLSAVPGNLAASLTSLAASSPRAQQLAKALGGWRGTPSRPSSTSSAAGAAAARGNRSTGATSSSSTTMSGAARPGHVSSNSFLSGLMTPPASGLRRTPDPSDHSSSAAAAAAFGRARMNSSGSVSARRSEKAPAVMGISRGAPSTPPLLRGAEYDGDALDGGYSESGFYDDDESTVEGTPRRGGGWKGGVV